MSVFYLALAITAEVIATTALKAADGFTRPGPSLLVVCGYVVAFLCLSFSLKELPVGVAYATWAGVGTASITILGWVLYEESLNVPAVCGIGLIIVGVGLVNLYSQAH